jgi:hypothetical protein
MKASFCVFFFLISFSGFAQNLDSLKLSNTEIPVSYKTTGELLCKSIQAKILYDKPELYSSMMGDVKRKDFQSFKSDSDEGSILYIEYEKNIEGWDGFLSGLLWGGNKPTKEHPEEYVIRNNILVIWSFQKKSIIKALSKAKVSSIKF